MCLFACYAAATMGRLAGVRALVVDDDPAEVELLRVLLEEAGAHVRGAHSAQEALEYFQGDPPHVLLCDIAMPEASGLVLIRRIRSAAVAPEVPAIAISALPWEEHRRQALDAGFSEWVSKPAAHVIVDVVARLLRRA